MIVADQKSGADKMLWGGPWQVAEVGQEKQNRMGGGEQEKRVKEVSMCVCVCKYVFVCEYCVSVWLFRRMNRKMNKRNSCSFI